MRYFEKIAETTDTFSAKKMFKDYVGPSLVAGPAVGALFHVARNRGFAPKELAKDLAIGTVADMGTGALMGAWNQRHSLFKKKQPQL